MVMYILLRTLLPIFHLICKLYLAALTVQATMACTSCSSSSCSLSLSSSSSRPKFSSSIAESKHGSSSSRSFVSRAFSLVGIWPKEKKQKKKPFPFLKLPPELREMIYQELFNSCRAERGIDPTRIPTSDSYILPQDSNVP